MPNKNIKSFFIGILLVLLLNPFYLLYINFIARDRLLERKINLYWWLPLSFGIFFFYRDYGVSWVIGSGDDIPAYLWMYHSNIDINYLDIILRFIKTPSQNEPLWHFIWWPFINIGTSDELFILMHYLLIFYLLFYSANKLVNKKYTQFIILGLLTLNMSLLESITFLWRQQIAFSLFLIGISYYFLNHKSGRGFLFILSSIFFHLSSIIYVALFIELIFIKVFMKKYAFIIAILFNLMIIKFLFEIFQNISINSGINSIITYVNGDMLISSQFIFINSILAIFLLFKYLFLNDNRFDELISLIFFSVVFIAFFYPNASGIYIRLLYFIYPLCSIIFLRLIIKYNSNYLLIYGNIFFIFFLIRSMWQFYINTGIIPFLAKGNILNPFMGVVQILFSI